MSMTCLRMVNDITVEMENNTFSVGLFIDVSKAFKTVNHHLLINKCNIIASVSEAIQWFKDYLTI